MANNANNGQTVAILSYLTIIGWIVALILHSQEKTKLGGFHLRQALLLGLVAIVLGWIPIIGWLLLIALFVFWIMGLISAVQGKMDPLPVIGEPAQRWFSGL
jgi:uncharacterized membrane protein